jgi:hypothetical protein
VDYERIQVECYSGYKLNERPRSFIYQGQRYEIQEIINRWYEGGIDSTRPEESYFKARTNEGRIFILRYLFLFDSWSIGIVGQ